MKDIVKAYIDKHRLLPDQGKPVLVGLSGGADSVALLNVLQQLRYNCISLHCNFHLRGEESMRDERFARELASTLGIPFEKIDFDTTAYATQKHISIEMAARELRYEWFEQIRKRENAQAIAVAHHKDDNVETVLMNLIRGTGIRGLCGIRPRNEYVVRPLLQVDRAMILQWLTEQGQSYVTDSTNLSDIYTRNFIRLRILPLLKELNPSVTSAISRLTSNLASVETIYNSFLDKAKTEIMKENGRISISSLINLPSPETILYELVKEYGFSRQVSADIFNSLQGEPGKTFYSATHRLLKDRMELIIVRKEEKTDNVYRINNAEEILSFPIELSCRKIVINNEFSMRKQSSIAYFDYDKLTFPLILRKWEKGDWFIPFGMTGRKKVSDYFSDHKFNRIEKETAWLLCSGKCILWIVGERTDNRFRVDGTTKQVLEVFFSAIQKECLK